MNIFKELALSVYSYKSYKDFLHNKKSKVFGFGVMLMLIYFTVTMVAPFVQYVASTGGFAKEMDEFIPEFELEDGYLWIDDVIEMEYDGMYIYIDTDPEYYFYDAEEMEEYLYDYYQVLLMDSEKVIMKSEGEVMGFYYSDLGVDFSKEDLLGWVPYMYMCVIIFLILAYIWMTGLFFFGVLFVALIGMIVASCMKREFTFGQLYLLGVYSRTLPLIIKAVLSLLSINIPFFVVINFGISVAIIACAIQKMKEGQLQQPLEFTSGNYNYNANNYAGNGGNVNTAYTGNNYYYGNNGYNGNSNYNGNDNAGYNHVENTGADGNGSSVDNNGNDFSWMK